jgi:4-alpha-glucanotransferase
MLEELAAQRAAGLGADVEPPRAIAEDLGVIPPFARATLRELEMPGYRVLPWEKEGTKVRDSRAFPRNSVASWSTHDTLPIVAWWEELPELDRLQFSEAAELLPTMTEPERSLALLRHLYRSSSDLALVLVQELLGLRDRINTPATVGPHNWTWRLPADIEDLAREPGLAARFEAIRGLVEASGR